MFGAEDKEDDYCVILGREIPGGCEEEICNGLDTCPYYTKGTYKNLERKED